MYSTMKSTKKKTESVANALYQSINIMICFTAAISYPMVLFLESKLRGKLGPV